MRFRNLLAVLALSLPSLAQVPGHCIVAHTDKPNGNCFSNSACSLLCPVRHPGSESSRLIPGFFTEQKDGREVIVGVIPNSSAQDSGVVAGDELVAVDGVPAPFTGDTSPWENKQFHTVQLRRGSEIVSANITMAKTQDLLARLPADHTLFEPVSFSRNSSTFLTAPFLSGMMLHPEGAAFVIDRVILNSPAARAGLHSGETVSVAGEHSVESLERANERKTLKIVVHRGDRSATTTVRFASLSELFESASAN
jgi:predicted metalloprotease with PDZ domain